MFEKSAADLFLIAFLVLWGLIAVFSLTFEYQSIILGLLAIFAGLLRLVKK